MCSDDNLELPDLIVIHDHESLNATTHYHIPENTTLFVLFRPKTLLSRWCGIDAPNDTIVINPTGQDYVVLTPDGYDAIEILVSNTTILEMDLLPDWLIPLLQPDGWGFPYLMARRYGLRVGLDVARGPEDTVVYMAVGSNWN